MSDEVKGGLALILIILLGYWMISSTIDHNRDIEALYNKCLTSCSPYNYTINADRKCICKLNEVIKND